jgi:hypothetical protein
VLVPSYQAEVNADDNIMVKKSVNLDNTSSWLAGKFSFTAQPLRLVLNEIERQYGVRINFQSENEYLYTGFFSREIPVSEVLELVCKPFGLTFAKRSEKTYEVYSN